MITAIVKFKIPAGTTREAAAELFKKSVPTYRGIPGLIRKYYLFDEGGTAGGAYLWESREAAESTYSVAWRQSIKERFGNEPVIEYFTTDVVVDNSSDGIQDAAE